MPKSLIFILISIFFLTGCKKKSTEPNPEVGFEVLNIEATPDKIYVGQTVSLTASVYNPDNDTLSYLWSVSSGLLQEYESNPVNWKAPDTVTTVEVTVNVKNKQNASELYKKNFMVLDRVPVFNRFSVPRKQIVVGNQVTIHLDYTEPDSQDVNVHWYSSSGQFLSESDSVAVWQAPFTEQTVNIWVTLSDSSHTINSDSLELQVYREYGCVWVVERGKKQLSKYTDNGQLLFTYTELSDPLAIKVNQRDKSCWVSDGSFQQSSGRILRISFNGDTITTIGNFTQIVDMDTYILEKDVWALDAKDNKLYQISAVNSSIIKTITGFNHAQALEVNQATRELWIADTDNDRVIKLDPDVPDLYNVNSDSGFHQITMVQDPVDVSVDVGGDAVWVAQRFQHKVSLLRDGFAPLVFTDLNNPMAVQATPNAYTCWIADTGNNRLLKVEQDRVLLSVENDFLLPGAMEMNDFNGNFWVIDSENNRVIKINDDGTIQNQIIGLDGPWDISLNLGQ